MDHAFRLDMLGKGLHEKVFAMARDNHNSQKVPLPLHKKKVWHLTLKIKMCRFQVWICKKYLPFFYE